MGNAAAIASFLLSKTGKAQTAGIMGNMKVESNFNTQSLGVNDGGPGVTAVGICQWEGGRRSNLQAWASGRGTNETDLNTQLTFFIHEITTSYSLVWQTISAMTDPAQVAAEVDAHYEVSSGNARQQRMDYANTYYASLMAGKAPEDGGPVTASSGTPTPGYGDGGHIKGTSPPVLDPPLDPANLHPPLDAATRKTLTDWLTSTHLGFYNNRPDKDTLSDDQLIGVYKDAIKTLNWQIPGSGIIGDLTDWTKTLGGILHWFTVAKNWERIGLFVLGATIIFFAAVELFKSQLPGGII